MKTLNKIFTPIFIFLQCILPAHSLPEFSGDLSSEVEVIETGSSMDISVGDQAIIEYNSFSIKDGESVNFDQPSSSSVVLNRVKGSDSSSIYGRLSANGRVFLVNRNGITIGSSGKIDTASFVGSVLDISDSDFMSGNLEFKLVGSSSASLVNSGTIEVSSGGIIALIAPIVENKGKLRAPKGEVALASAERVSLDFDGDGLINFSLSGALSSSLVKNSGSIKAGGVLLTAKAKRSVMDSVVNNTGKIEATSISGSGGVIQLISKENGTVKNTGTLEADNGKVKLIGERVEHMGKIEANSGKVELNGEEELILSDSSEIFARGGDVELKSGGEDVLFDEESNSDSSEVSDDSNEEQNSDNTGDSSDQSELPENSIDESADVASQDIPEDGAPNQNTDTFEENGSVNTEETNQDNFSDEENNPLVETESDSLVLVENTESSSGLIIQDGLIDVSADYFENDQGEVVEGEAGKISIEGSRLESNGELLAKADNDTNGGLIDVETQDGIHFGEDAIVDASQGEINLKSEGDVISEGTIRAKDLNEEGATFKVSGTYEVEQATVKNEDKAINLGSGNYSGTINDVQHIIVDPGANINLTGDTVFRADSDWVGGVSDGIFFMGTGSQINGNNFNLDIISGLVSTLENIDQVNTLTLSGLGANSAFILVDGISSNNLVLNNTLLLAPGTTSFSVTSDFNINNGQFRRFSGGDGSMANPFQVFDVFGLQGIHTVGPTNLHYQLINDIDASVTTNWNGGFGFNSLYETGIPSDIGFEGSFNGQSFTIDSLFINRPGSQAAGLFGFTKNASVSNLNLTNVNITGDQQVGSLVGLAQNTVIDSVVVGGQVNGVGSIGGVVGNSRSGYIDNARSSVVVNGNQAGFYSGGLIGIAQTQTYINNSFSSAVVIGGSAVGGLVGMLSEGFIQSSSSQGEVRGVDSIGGLVGYNLSNTSISQIKDSTSAANVMDLDGGTSRAGGLVGTNDGGLIISSSSMGNVFGSDQTGGLVGSHLRGASSTGHVLQSFSGGQVAGANQTGGLIGYNTGAVIASYSTGNVFGANQTGGLVGFNDVNGTIRFGIASNGSVNGQNIVGGLVGQNNHHVLESMSFSQINAQNQAGGIVGYNNTTGIISEVYSEGNVAVSGNNAGGFVGVNQGQIVNTYATGEVTGTDSLGGFVGDMIGGSISRSYSKGLVNGNGAANFIGGFVGQQVLGTHVDNFFNQETSNQNFAAGFNTNPAGIAGISSSQMQDGTTFNTWDFTLPGGEWIMAGDPHLQIEHTTDIRDTVDLQLMAIDPTDTYTLFNDIDASETLGWNNGQGFNPVDLTGTFEGQGFRIDGLNINRPSTDNVGLFSTVGATGLAQNFSILNARIQGQNNVGGVSGQNMGQLLGIDIIQSQVTGNDNIGGFVGQNGDGGIIQNSHADVDVVGQNNVGGFAGQLFNNSQISDSISTGDVVGQNNVGGFLGNVPALALTASIIERALSTGKVNGETNFGGFIGSIEFATTLIALFWDATNASAINTDQDVGFNMGFSSEVSQINGLETTELLKQSTFENAGWDFNTVWKIDEGTSYPYLREAFKIEPILDTEVIVSLTQSTEDSVVNTPVEFFDPVSLNTLVDDWVKESEDEDEKWFGSVNIPRYDYYVFKQVLDQLVPGK